MPERGTGTEKKRGGQESVLNQPNRAESVPPESPADKAEGQQGRTLAEILRHEKATVFFFDSPTLKKKAVIALLEDFSPQEQEALYPLQPLIIDLDDNLLEKILELQKDNNQLQSLALVDGLTGLYNNRFFTNQLDKEMSRTRRTGLPCCLLMMDLDNFKTLNDTLGHIEGNRFLVAVAEVFRESLRSSDTICRFGGDEFTVIMPATNLYEAVRVADRLIKAVKKIADPLELGVSLSAGVGEYNTTSTIKLNEFIQAADAALYEAKRSGKNRLAVPGKAQPSMDEKGMVSVEEKEVLFALKDLLQQKGENDDR